MKGSAHERSSHGSGAYYSRVEGGGRAGQQGRQQELEEQEVAKVVGAQLGLKAILCLAFWACHDTCAMKHHPWIFACQLNLHFLHHYSSKVKQQHTTAMSQQYLHLQENTNTLTRPVSLRILVIREKHHFKPLK